MDLCLISGSQNLKSQSIKVTKYIANKADQLGFKNTIIELVEESLPFWSVQQLNNPKWLKIKNIVAKAQAFVMTTPEWDGMATPALKNFLLYCSTTLEMAHKPALLVAVSAGMGGSYPISELRSSGYKNTKLCYIPEHIIVKKVVDMFNGNDQISESEQGLNQRIEFSLDLLMKYAKALKNIRDTIDLNKYENGM